jgi:hypothetical protein
MERVTVAWALSDTTAFERNVPLLWAGRRLRELGSRVEITVVMLEGFDRLSLRYRGMLSEVGYKLVDGSRAYSELTNQYRALRRFEEGGAGIASHSQSAHALTNSARRTFGNRCFLRWPLLRMVMPGARILHFDGDVVFNLPVEHLESDVGRFTFVLQGCPAFAVVDSQWLDAYCAELGAFVADPEGYSRGANAKAQDAAASTMKKWAGSRHRELISSDQDFISHLIHADLVPQARPEDVKSASRSLLFENPLYAHVYLKEHLPLKYERRGLTDYFSGVPVGLWHMQANFCTYLRMQMARLPLCKRFRLEDPLRRRSADYYVMRCKEKLKLQSLSREAIYRRYFVDGDFSAIFHAETFWEPSAFRAR